MMVPGSEAEIDEDGHAVNHHDDGDYRQSKINHQQFRLVVGLGLLLEKVHLIYDFGFTIYERADGSRRRVNRKS